MDEKTKTKKKSENQSVTARKRREKKKENKKSTWASIEIKTKNFPYQILVLWSSGNKSKQKNRWSTDLFFFIVVFSVLSCSLPCNCYLSNFGKTWLCYSTIIITTIYAKCAICVQCISNHVLKTPPIPLKKTKICVKFAYCHLIFINVINSCPYHKKKI